VLYLSSVAALQFMTFWQQCCSWIRKLLSWVIAQLFHLQTRNFVDCAEIFRNMCVFIELVWKPRQQLAAELELNIYGVESKCGFSWAGSKEALRIYLYISFNQRNKRDKMNGGIRYFCGNFPYDGQLKANWNCRQLYWVTMEATWKFKWINVLVARMKL